MEATQWESVRDALPFRGLTAVEVSALQVRYGKNLPKKAVHSTGKIVLDVIREPMFLLLIVACFLYFILGEIKQGSMMAASMAFVAAISIYQEMRSNRALAALQKLTEPSVQVIRDGQLQSIPSEEMVPGDIFLAEEGHRIPADATILSSHDLSINESILTGESVPVEKNSEPGGNVLIQGTTVNSGTCYARVTTTGEETQLGRLGRSVQTIQSPPSLLQIRVGRFVKTMAFFGMTAFVVVCGVNFLHTGDFSHSLLLGLTLAMSAVPEEIPVAFSSFMALGALRMNSLGIIVRQPQIIENLGTVTVICLDKTGTITENKMEVRWVFDANTGVEEEIVAGDEGGAGFEGGAEVDGGAGVERGDVVKKDGTGWVLWYARLASEPEPFDVMEQAIVRAQENRPGHKDYRMVRLIHEYPLEGRPPMMTHVYSGPKGILVAAKGATERILSVCRLEEARKEAIRGKAAALAAAGYRVLAVCSADGPIGPYPQRQDDFDWRLEGLVALYDPPKENARKTFGEWQSAGIRVLVLSGDYPGTVLHVAGETGIPASSSMTGDQVEQLSPEQLRGAAQQINVYARMFPQAKLKLIEALKAGGEIVAMTGDGVNDGPALKAAHIGIAMGNKGTEIAREAASLILSDDNLDRVTAAIRQGRTIYANLKKAIRYLVSIHIPILVIASLPLLLNWKFPTIFTPIHVIFLELIMGPTCSIFFEKEPVEDAIMKRAPRKGRPSLFEGAELYLTISQGLIAVAGMLLLYWYFMQAGYTLDYTRTVVFTALLINNLLMTFANRSYTASIVTTLRYRNNLVPVVVALSILFFVFIYFIPYGRSLFGMTPVNGLHLLAAVGGGFVTIAWIEVFKWVLRHIHPGR